MKNKKDEFKIDMKRVDVITSLSFIVQKINQMFPVSKYDPNNLT